VNAREANEQRSTPRAAVVLLSLFIVTGVAAQTNTSNSGAADFLRRLNPSQDEAALAEHRRLSESFKSGTATTSILRMDWFSGGVINYCQVSADGMVAIGDYVGLAGSGRGAWMLPEAKRNLLAEVIQHLPPPPHQVPKERWLLAAC